ncbi:MAG: hypothetical protein M1825_005108 [Sarcosagium campestre]|nr:MAG: hypothetical protein M1825_005108 [Sarcosagium campestre]
MGTTPPEADDPLAQVRTKYKRIKSEPENPFAALIPDQSIAIVPSFTLESGVTLHNVPVAYWAKGTLSSERDNVIVVCHALTGSSDVSDWWGPILGGSGRALDISRFYVICINCLGSPYGTASPVTYRDGDPSKGRYGPCFPLTTIRDDVNLQKLLLDDLDIKQVAVVIGGSMGGMMALEWAYFGPDYVRCVVPIATSSRHSAWGISWGEAQRQSIYSDPKYEDGYYSFDDPPSTGLGAARMSALLTYRSRNSFEARFGRNAPDPARQISSVKRDTSSRPTSSSKEHWSIHNEGHRHAKSCRDDIDTPDAGSNDSSSPHLWQQQQSSDTLSYTDPQFSGARTFTSSTTRTTTPNRAPTHFSAQSYLRYQGEKFVKRFDSNCYIAITRKLDTHDVSRHRTPLPSSSPTSPSDSISTSTLQTTEANSGVSTVDAATATAQALSLIKQPVLVLGIESDGLFTFSDQRELAAGIPNARLRTIDSPEGHDAFLLQFEQVNSLILEFLGEHLPHLMNAPPRLAQEVISPSDTNTEGDREGVKGGVGQVVKSSTFGEAEVEDITAW